MTEEPTTTVITTTEEPTTTVITTTEEPTTTVITTTEEPTTTVITTTEEPTTTVITTTEASVCTINDFEADDNGNCFKVVTTKLNWAKVSYVGNWIIFGETLLKTS